MISTAAICLAMDGMDDAWMGAMTDVGSTQVHFLMCALEIPQKWQHKLLLLTLVIWFTIDLL